MRKYFVSFTAIDERGYENKACVVLEREHPVTDMEDIRALITDVRNLLPIQEWHVVINNWRPMELPE